MPGGRSDWEKELETGISAAWTEAGRPLGGAWRAQIAARRAAVARPLNAWVGWGLQGGRGPDGAVECPCGILHWVVIGSDLSLIAGFL